MNFILYQTQTGKYNKVPIKDSQFTISVRDNINIFFLLEDTVLSEEIKEGTLIYRG